MFIATLGCIIMSIGINVFTTPWNFYTTGLVGYSQFLRSVLVEDYGITLSNIDLAGVIYYALSIPIFIITFKGLGRSFFLRTLVFTAVFSLTTAFIPVPSAPVINDRLTCVLIGSVCVGVVITCGCTVGGLDMLAMHITKKTGLQVGKFTILANILLFVLCFFRYDFSVVVYSVLYMVFSSLILDRMHQQSINMQALIFTKYRDNVIPQRIMEETGRGVTRWDGYGAYTNEPTAVLCTCINRYELEQLERIVKGVDPKAFIITTSNVHINGNFIHKV
jgi:uncharacterized membrane-anchored protein YitT (DUF2179 family)